MTRSYTAARREHLDEPVSFEVNYVREGDPKAPEDSPQRHDTPVTDTFVCRGQVSSLMLAEFARNADMDTAEPEAVAMIAEFFKQAFGDDREYRRFFRMATQYLDDDGVMAILAGLVEDFLGRPTKRRSGSPGSPSTSGPSTKDASEPQAELVAGEVLPTPDELAAVRQLREQQAAASSS